MALVPAGSSGLRPPRPPFVNDPFWGFDRLAGYRQADRHYHAMTGNVTWHGRNPDHREYMPDWWRQSAADLYHEYSLVTDPRDYAELDRRFETLFWRARTPAPPGYVPRNPPVVRVPRVPGVPIMADPWAGLDPAYDPFGGRFVLRRLRLPANRGRAVRGRGVRARGRGRGRGANRR